MFGDIKKVVRIARTGIEDWSFGRKYPQVARRYQALVADCEAPEFIFKVEPVNKIVYVEIPKAACSTIKAILTGDSGDNKLTTIRSIGIAAFFEMMDAPERFLFSFVRNPYTRLISCYRNKFYGRPWIHAIGYRQDILRFFGARVLRLDATKPLPFDWFIEMAAGTNRTTHDGHWAAMGRMIPSASLRCDFIGRVENFDRDIAVVRDRVGVSTAPPHLNRSGGHMDTATWITEPLRQTIYRAYRDDFDRFEYSPALPR